MIIAFFSCLPALWINSVFTALKLYSCGVAVNLDILERACANNYTYRPS